MYNRDLNRNRGRGQRPTDHAPSLDHKAMTHYYDNQGHLKPDVFIQWPKQLVDRIRDSRTNLRRAFDHVVALRVRIQMGESPESVLKPGIPKLHRFAEYQRNRDVIEEETKKFIQTHCDAIGHDQKKFEGFFQLFQSVLAYKRR